MLKNIDTLLSPELLFALQSMGHGDTLAIVDANFPARSKAKNTLIYLNGVDSSRTLSAILSILPLDDFTQFPIQTMRQIDSDTLPDAALDFIKVIDNSEEKRHKTTQTERFSFYGHVEHAQLVIATSDLRPYACILLQKGVIFN